MIDTITLGKRLRFFRERSGISQFDLEVQLDASPGSLSRIESGRTNPKKETIIQFAQLLHLNDRELDYLIGITSCPATQNEIDLAILEVKDYFEQKVFAYLIDDRWRLLKITDHFRKALGLSEEYIQSVLGTATIRFVMDPDLKIVDRFSPKELPEVLDNNLRFFYKEVGFMNDDINFQKAVESIGKNPIAKKIWNTINYERDIKYNFSFGRKVNFRMFGKFDIPFTYKYESLLKNSRFKVVEYTPANTFVKLLTELLP